MKNLSHLTQPAFVLLLTTAIVLADATLRQADETPRAPKNPADLMKQDRFTFVRVEYDSSGGFGESWYRYEGRDWERWETDFPRAERNLLFRLTELTSLSINPEPISLRLTDSRIFDYPFLFMSDVGWQVLSRQEKGQLHRYLKRGGFLWVDDFWGGRRVEKLLRKHIRFGSGLALERNPPGTRFDVNCLSAGEMPTNPRSHFLRTTKIELRPARDSPTAQWRSTPT